ncbi:hypothetical protein GQ55_8G204200 [Panicum hallii var. hallii]|uniref:Knottin scorpion toxin-like domain-containing protein n=1 Tax=Panicum hallii var. hallii TaxID=1504633 RepID=A0A2T7CPE1_9POAL|nr:hypothetical protein GQ55_8G204200 [Panicum hallii var. hallii]
MSFNGRSAVTSFVFALLLMSCWTGAPTTICKVEFYLGCDSSCKGFCVDNGYTDGHCHEGELPWCVCIRPCAHGEEPASKKPASPGWNRMGMLDRSAAGCFAC